MSENNKLYTNLGLVVAIGKNGEIGYQNNLIWRIKEDLQFFKNVTMDSYMIMGRKTYESMPKNLPGRQYIVLSRDEEFILESSKIVHRNIDETLSFVSQNSDSKFWVVGGGVIYSAFLPFVNTMHITEIDDSFQKADAFFPQFDRNDWYEESGELMHSEDNLEYRHKMLVRKR